MRQQLLLYLILMESAQKFWLQPQSKKEAKEEEEEEGGIGVAALKKQASIILLPWLSLFLGQRYVAAHENISYYPPIINPMSLVCLFILYSCIYLYTTKYVNK